MKEPIKRLAITCTCALSSLVAQAQMPQESSWAQYAHALPNQTHFDKWVKSVYWRYGAVCDGDLAYKHPAYPKYFQQPFSIPESRSHCGSMAAWNPSLCFEGKINAFDTFRPKVLTNSSHPDFPSEWLVVGGQSLSVGGYVTCRFTTEGEWTQKYTLPQKRIRPMVEEKTHRLSRRGEPWTGTLQTGILTYEAAPGIMLQAPFVIVR